MNWWMLAGAVMAAICAGGHAFAGWNTFYRPIASAITDELQAGVFTGMWHMITIHFALSALALGIVAVHAGGSTAGWLIAAQFAGYAAAYFLISLRLGGVFKVFQWLPFAATALLAAAGALNA
jgi:hypothetical protein